jgi:hypothetical protein
MEEGNRVRFTVPRPAGLALAAMLATLVSTALIVSACGEERLSKPEYEQRVRETYADVQRAFRATDVDSTTLLAERVAAAQASLRRAADRLDDTAPPEEVESENDQLVAGLRAYADDLDALKQAVGRGDMKKIERFNTGAPTSKAITQIAAATEAMKEKRYDLEAIPDQ